MKNVPFALSALVFLAASTDAASAQEGDTNLVVTQSASVANKRTDAAPQKQPLAFENFITVKGARLMDGDEEFRFISFNVPTLLLVEDEMAFEMTNPYSLPTEYELRDLFETVRQMGGQVVRNYTIPVRHAGFPAEAPTYVEAPGVFNEEAFKTMDLAIALAGEYGVRIVFPLVNNWEWMGGRPQYAAFRGKESDEFWTDPQLIADFKLTIDHILNRVNTITGIPYKDDPTIMAWETGNELENPPEWSVEIARYIKSIDPNHLVIDGYNAIHYEDENGWTHQYPHETSIDESAIDLINTHHYEPSGLDTIENVAETLRRIDGRKPIFIGEFGFISATGVEMLLDYIADEPDIPGALIWSLRRHHKEGGFYHHTEPFGDGLYRAYHWPGFGDGEAFSERHVLAMIREYGFKVQGQEAPAIEAPAAPQLLPFEKSPMFSWRGSAGASGYDIERMTEGDSEWFQIAYNVDDIETPGFDLFTDESVQIGGAYCYRVKARNSAGLSPPSDAHCLDVERLTRVDRTRNLQTALSARNVTVRSDEHRSYKEAFSRLQGAAGAELVYRVPTGKSLVELRVSAFEDDVNPRLSFAVSSDGRNYQTVDVNSEAFVIGEKTYDYKVPIRYTLAGRRDAARFVKISFDDTVSITRVELDYQ